MNKTKWVYIGSGNICSSTACSIEKGDHEIVAVYSRNYEKAQDFAKKHNAKAYKTAEEAITSSGADAVYIGTPHTSHKEYAVLALKHQKPVLCEKAICQNSKDTEELIACAKENDTYLAEAMWTWYSDVALTVKKWVQEGEIGEVKSFFADFCIPGIFMNKKSRVFNPQTAGGSLLDITIYPITYIYNLFGYPEKIECKGKVKNGIDIRETVILSYGDLKCTAKGSFDYFHETCRIVGTKGTITVPIFHMGSRAILKNKNGKTVYKGKTDYLTEFTRVSEEIKQGKKESSFVPLSATLNCMRIMDECRRQMALVYPTET